MKIIEIKKEDLKKNIKNNKSIIICIILLSVLLGCCVGGIDIKNYSINNTTTAQPQEELQLNNIEKNGGYYYNAFMNLKEKNAYLIAYLECLDRINLSENSKNIVDDLVDEIDLFQTSYKDAENFFLDEAPFSFTEKEQTLSFYDKKINELERYYSQKSPEKVNGSEDKSANKELLKRIDAQIEILNEHVSIITVRDKNVSDKISGEADRVLESNYQKINSIIDHFNKKMDEIQKNDNYEIEYCKRFFYDYDVETEAMVTGSIQKEIVLGESKDQALIYAKSVEGIDVKKERFLAIVSFFMLFGIVVAIIIGALYQKREKE